MAAAGMGGGTAEGCEHPGAVLARGSWCRQIPRLNGGAGTCDVQCVLC